MFGLDFTPNQKRAIFALLGLALIFIAFGICRHSAGTGGVVIREPGSGRGGVAATDSDTERRGNREYVVNVAGAVAKPGNYRLASGARVQDAIDAAGGTTSDADLQAINPAAKLVDGSKIEVPRVGANPSGPGGGVSISVGEATQGSSGGKSSNGKFKNPGDGTVSINSAGVDELQKLPGVGPATAQAIVSYRQQIGRFGSVQQLMDVKGIGPKKLEKMLPFLRL